MKLRTIRRQFYWQFKVERDDFWEHIGVRFAIWVGPTKYGNYHGVSGRLPK